MTYFDPDATAGVGEAGQGQVGSGIHFRWGGSAKHNYSGRRFITIHIAPLIQKVSI
jgi:hypothetical protein